MKRIEKNSFFTIESRSHQDTFRTHLGNTSYIFYMYYLFFFSLFLRIFFCIFLYFFVFSNTEHFLYLYIFHFLNVSFLEFLFFTETTRIFLFRILFTRKKFFRSFKFSISYFLSKFLYFCISFFFLYFTLSFLSISFLFSLFETLWKL